MKILMLILSLFATNAITRGTSGNLYQLNTDH
jgi:hypothetical protein